MHQTFKSREVNTDAKSKVLGQPGTIKRTWDKLQINQKSLSILESIKAQILNHRPFQHREPIKAGHHQ